MFWYISILMQSYLEKLFRAIFPERPFQRWKVIDDCVIILLPTLNRRLDYEMLLFRSQ